MLDDEVEMRVRLVRVWNELAQRLTAGAEFPAHLVYETLSEVGTEGMMRNLGASSAVNMLRLRADAMEANERRGVGQLITGEARP